MTGGAGCLGRVQRLIFRGRRGFGAGVCPRGCRRSCCRFGHRLGCWHGSRSCCLSVDAHEKSWRVVVLWRLIVRSADGARRAQSHGAGAVECALNTRNSVLELCFCRSAVSGVSFNDIARSRSATSPALSLETYPVSLLVRVFFTGALVLLALFLATFWRPALVAAVCLVRAMAKMVLSGL